MKNLRTGFFICITTCFLTACGSNTVNDSTVKEAPIAKQVDEKQNLKNKETVKDTPTNNIDAQEKGKINWVSIEDAERFIKQEPRKVVVDLYTDWCGWCKKMDKATFQNKKIADYINEHFYAVKFNAENKNAINFKGKKFEFVQAGRRGYNQLAYDFASGRMSYPTVSFLDENLELIKAFPGFKQPDQFEPYLKFVSENHYKSKTMAEFAQEFKKKNKQ